MDIDMRDAIDIGLIGMIPVLGAVTAIALEKVVTSHGHSFMQMGPKSALFIGTIGAVQNFAAFFFSLVISIALNSDIDKSGIRTAVILLAGSTVTAGLLIGLTAAAAKVNLISNRLSVVAGTTLLLTSFVENLAIMTMIDLHNEIW